MDAIVEKNSLSEDMIAQSAEAAGLMKTLSNQWRLLILCMLVDGEKSVTELEKNLATKQPNVSQQLARLRMEGYVKARRDGRVIYYALADARVKAVLESLHAVFCPPETEIASPTSAPYRKVNGRWKWLKRQVE